ncbi:MAG: bifunctional diaminohydroxyphosphoribosylaminopyrimidine deaminase/5-amino-6-(5-phosphoribosylamino)uracil reductase RibD [Synergistaceae bacterium]|nr:bifunctional diaminohydroxyphosphoribosylaminopyrimidine deaminase/5-amino-6-(5-phosphoribosylamino)uracil reductase RibD [Synergistaceae bacterium]
MASTGTKIHEYYMRMALSMALRGTGRVSPNPRVGCVIVDYGSRGGRVVSCGYHKKYGDAHAETNALRNAGGSVAGMTAYVSLEPCCHTGHTSPCCDALIKAGVSRVVIGMSDPDPRVSGKGIAAMSSAGVEVIQRVLENECRRINRGFVKRVTEGRPWVSIKAAMSLDGDIALANGESKWITGGPARRLAHLMRAENDAVLVGVGTVLKDDPMLSVRDSDGVSPMKSVVDRDLKTPPEARVLSEGNCVIFSGPSPDESKFSSLLSRGAKIIKMETDAEGRIPPGGILREFASMGVNNLLVEGGAGLVSSFVKARAADEFSLFVSPRIMGNGIGAFGGLSFELMNGTIRLKDVRYRKIGEDFLIKGVPECSRAL